MRPFSKLITGYLLMFLFSCNDNSLNYSITTKGNLYYINDSIILANQNLPHLIDGLENSDLREVKHYAQIPDYIRAFLSQLEGNGFLIADSDEDFTEGCTGEKGKPSRQTTYIGFNDNLFVMSYKQGGIALIGKIVILKFKKNKIIDFWSGNGTIDLDTKLKIIAHLNENKNKYLGLNTNFVYI